MFVEVVIMTNNTQFKTLVNTWLNQKKPMITPSTHASFTLIAENHLIPYFGKRKIGSITETDIQSYISYLHDAGRLDKTGGLTVKTIRDVILVLRLSMEFAYKERAIPLLNWDLIEYPKELGIKKVVSLSKDQEQALIQCIYMNLNRKTAGILIALFTGVRIGELCGLQMKDISLTDKTISINKTVQRIYDKKKGESYLHIGPPKTKTSARTIPVPSLLMNIIKKFYTDTVFTMLDSEGILFALFLCDIKGNRVNDRNRFTLLMSISDRLSGSAGASIPNRDQDIRMINHITVALVHAVGRVMGLNQCFLITLGRNVEIPISQSFRPLCGLTFTWDGAFERNSRIGRFQSQNDLSGIHIYTDCHSGYKVRDAFIFD